MIAYLDSSVILRWLLKEKEAVSDIHLFSKFISSELIRVECFRTLERIHIRQLINEQELSLIRQKFFEILLNIELIEINRSILQRACDPFPTTLGSLDAIHLSSALLWKDFYKKDLIFLTHDQELHNASRSMGFSVFE